MARKIKMAKCGNVVAFISLLMIFSLVLTGEAQVKSKYVKAKSAPTEVCLDRNSGDEVCTQYCVAETNPKRCSGKCFPYKSAGRKECYCHPC
ncbi:hypothetical protein IGI04_002540 [Brassica rapa subsp. trilocularis]|uniref:Knottin scorpion toxin-like domain-containing protein n=3 Tax=Brassica TaxID=3705 RepID=A0A3P5ZVE0_BRACM|nr:hypothetical protein IGI04_002540 [Brassica rapa subsp. trilocularis]KAH0942565.1 hypothetical protein HID58_002202 [Brassica napus]CAF2151748.1 unnamed protein product [Brassica napus]CAG7888514.1 unnamed protein product [Brassica rapa]VDC75918.1 unnamed protein product [Brassica rapa]